MTRLTSSRSAGLTGSVRVPGDKSISHRALILGTLSVGETVIDGLLTGDDVMRTAGALRAFGAGILPGDRPDRWHVWGVGVGGLAEPPDVLDLGNSGTGVRLLMGVAASHPLTAIFTGDASLRRRPMDRIVRPLEEAGARFEGRANRRLPMAVIGAEDPLPITYRLPVASAQVKSAILLAGLNAPGTTTVIEPAPTRDHTERLLRHLGATLEIESIESGGRQISLHGQPELSARPVRVPGDPSSAAFLAVAALVTPGSDIMIEGVGVNPHRTGLYETLKEMGGDIAFLNEREESGEPVADIRVRASALAGVEVPARRAPSMIDEYPALAAAAALAAGETAMRGIGELRVKESDRIQTMAEGLRTAGIECAAGPAELIVRGTGGAPLQGGNAVIETHDDHRIAMAFLVLGLNAARGVTIDEDRMIGTSFPGFVPLLRGLGGRIGEEAPA